jgi:hypothetical protein
MVVVYVVMSAYLVWGRNEGGISLLLMAAMRIRRAKRDPRMVQSDWIDSELSVRSLLEVTLIPVVQEDSR